MKTTTLVFPTMYVLWQFKNAIKANSVEINVQMCSLTCDCKEADVKLAVEQYGAKVRE